MYSLFWIFLFLVKIKSIKIFYVQKIRRKRERMPLSVYAVDFKSFYKRSVVPNFVVAYFRQFRDFWITWSTPKMCVHLIWDSFCGDFSDPSSISKILKIPLICILRVNRLSIISECFWPKQFFHSGRCIRKCKYCASLENSI